MVSALLPLFISFHYGAWADIFGRKILMNAVVFAQVLNLVIYLIGAIFISVPKEYFLIGSFLFSLTGQKTWSKAKNDDKTRWQRFLSVKLQSSGLGCWSVAKCNCQLLQLLLPTNFVPHLYTISWQCKRAIFKWISTTDCTQLHCWKHLQTWRHNDTQ